MGIWNPGPGTTAGDDAFSGDATDEIADGDFLRGGAGNALSGHVGDVRLDIGASDDLIDGAARRNRASYESAPGHVDGDLRLLGGGQLIVAPGSTSSSASVGWVRRSTTSSR